MNPSQTSSPSSYPLALLGAMDPRPAVRILCAWCGQGVGDAAVPAEDAEVSHGICAPCARRHFGYELTPRPADDNHAA